jgi:hypothetical protein
MRANIFFVSALSLIKLLLLLLFIGHVLLFDAYLLVFLSSWPRRPCYWVPSD